MSRSRSIAIAAVLSLVLCGGALARSSVIAQKSSPRANGLFLSHGLLPGHAYRLTVTTPKPGQIVGFANEYYVYMKDRRLGAGSKSLQLSGKTPYRVVVRQPTSEKISSWTFAVSVQARGGKGISAQLMDLGVRR